MITPKSLSQSSKRILMGAVYICGIVVIAAAMVKAKDTQMENKAKDIMVIYQADTGFKDPTTYNKLLSYHKQGLALATMLLMANENRGDALAARDALFIQAFETAPDTELVTLMESHQGLFDQGYRQEQLSRANQQLAATQRALTHDQVAKPRESLDEKAPEAVNAEPITKDPVAGSTTPDAASVVKSTPQSEISQPAEGVTPPETVAESTSTALLPEAEASVVVSQAATPNPLPSADQLSSGADTSADTTVSPGTEQTITQVTEVPVLVEAPTQPETPVISDKVRRETTSTLTVVQQASVQTCFTLLKQRYNTEDKMSQWHLILDSFLGSRSCN